MLTRLWSWKFADALLRFQTSLHITPAAEQLAAILGPAVDEHGAGVRAVEDLQPWRKSTNARFYALGFSAHEDDRCEPGEQG